MNNTIALTIFFATMSAYSFAQKSDEQLLRYLKEVEWPKAYREQDTVLLDRILADEFKMIDSDGGYYTKRDELNVPAPECVTACPA